MAIAQPQAITVNGGGSGGAGVVIQMSEPDEMTPLYDMLDEVNGRHSHSPKAQAPA